MKKVYFFLPNVNHDYGSCRYKNLPACFFKTLFGWLNFKLILFLLFIISGLINPAEAQTTIWTEDFESSNEDDIVGTGNPSRWTIASDGNINGYLCVKKVAEDLMIVANNTDVEGTIITEIIDISGFHNVNLFVNLSEYGGMESSDFIKVYYKLDGGDEMAFPYYGNCSGDFNSAVARTDFLNGNTVQIIIRVLNNALTEYYQIQQIEVIGFPIGAMSIKEFRTLQTGEWHNNNNWEIKTDVNDWASTTLIPGVLPELEIYPVVQGTATSMEGDNTTDHHVALPDNIQSGDLLIVLWSDGEKEGISINVPAGWTEFYSINYNNARYCGWYKVADGNEGPEILVTSNYVDKSAHNTYRIAKDSYSGVPVASIFTGTGTNPDPPELVSGFGDKKALWIIASHSSGDDGYPQPVAPDNYTDYLITSDYMKHTLVNPTRMISSRLALETESENPGSFTMGSNVDWAAATIAVQGNSTIPASVATIREHHVLTVNENSECDKIYIALNGTLKISGAARLSINNGPGNGIVVNSSSENETGGLIIDGFLENNASVMVQRWLPSNNWHLISSPVSDLGINDFAGNVHNRIRLWPDAATATEYDLASYGEEGDTWDYCTIAGNNGDFISGKGYSVRRTDAGLVTFSGTVVNNATAEAPIEVMLSRSLTGHGWNCIGNPFTSPIQATGAVPDAGLETFLSVNSEMLDPLFRGLYIWDQSINSGAGDYEVISQALSSFPGGESLSDMTNIAVGQGFIVKAADNDNRYVQFLPSMQRVADDVVFKSDEIVTPAIRLAVNTGNMINKTTVSFHNGMTPGLDPGYDVGKLEGNPDLALYTRLINGSHSDVDFAVQSLPLIDASEIRIPVGLNFSHGGEVTFSLEKSTGFPDETEVRFEDSQIQLFTDFEHENDSYTVTVPEGIQGTGRFFLIIKNKATTALHNPGKEPLHWVNTINKKIFIYGAVTEKTLFSVYSADGKLLIREFASDRNTNQIDGSTLPGGVYLMRLSENDRFVRVIKFILK